MDGSEKITSGLVIAGCNGSELLELTEEILDQMPCAVQVFVIEPLVRAMAFRRDDRGLAGPSQWFKYPYVGVIPFVRQEGVCIDIRKKCIGPVQITGLAAGQMEPRRVAQGINGRVDLGAQPTFASSDCLVLVFF
ncbi:MAG: hypothetical protein JWM42_210 [Burkholderia sp.]|nr:hypothetical protein [Burkholderia sp.]